MRSLAGLHVAALLRDLYREEEEPFDLAYRRRLGVKRLAFVLVDQVGLEFDEAELVAASFVGGVADA